jgi:peroxin-5
VEQVRVLLIDYRATLANYGQSEKAMEAYFNALHINSSYIRVRYNLAIACMQMGQHVEAVGYLLGALSIQEKSLHHVMRKTTPDLLPEMRQLQSEQSNSVWHALRLLLSTYSILPLTLVRRDDLLDAVDKKDLNAFRTEFEF